MANSDEMTVIIYGMPASLCTVPDIKDSEGVGLTHLHAASEAVLQVDCAFR